MRIGISLLTHNDGHLLKPALDSLLASDLSEHYYKLYCYDNNSTTPVASFLEDYSMDRWIHRSDTNDGIVVPRIRIYEEIKKGDFDFLLEIHTDMLFPDQWLTPLLELLDNETAILQPHIYQPRSRGIITLEEFKEVLPRLLNDNVYSRCRQTHPWLVNLPKLDQIGGYYDPNYSPHECEDDDLVYRILSNNLKIRSTGRSWVVHYGAMVRHILPSCLSDHMRYFETKNNITFNNFTNMFEYHPVYAE